MAANWLQGVEVNDESPKKPEPPKMRLVCDHCFQEAGTCWCKAFYASVFAFIIGVAAMAGLVAATASAHEGIIHELQVIRTGCLPAKSAHDSGYRGLRYPELLADCGHRQLAAFAEPSNLVNIPNGQFGISNSLAPGIPALSIPVPRIVECGSEKEMFGVAATRNVTFVANKQRSVELAVGDRISNSVRLQQLAAKANESVPSPVSWASPSHTAIVVDWSKAIFESLFKRLPLLLIEALAGAVFAAILLNRQPLSRKFASAGEARAFNVRRRSSHAASFANWLMRAACTYTAVTTVWFGTACGHDGIIHEHADHFPQYTDADSRTLSAGETFSTKLAWLTYHNLGTFDVDGAEIVLLDRPFDHQFDPQETGHGFIGHGGSTVKLRNSVIRSENTDNPGHFLCTGACKVDIEGCTFDGVGRTTLDQLDNAHLDANRKPLHIPANQIGRYALHLHHVTLPFRVVDTILKNGRKVALAIHNSDGGLVERVTVDNFAGAGIVLEAGSENDNVIRDSRITNIRGDGLGVQGHDGGIDAKLVGDDTPGNPRRTIGGQFSEGAGIWLRAIANDILANYVADCEFGCVIWGRHVIEEGAKVDGITQRGHKIDGNTFKRVKTGFSIQGTLDPVTISNQTVRDFNLAFDTSYNLHVILENCLLENGKVCWRNGFTEKLTLNDCTVRNVGQGFEIFAGLEVNGGDFTGIPGSAFNIFYRHVAPRTIVIRNAKVNGLSRTFNDANKSVDYTINEDVLIYNYNGVEGDNFQLFLNEQADDYIPKNLTDGNPRRMTPEPGLTNKQLEVQHCVRFGGKRIPKGAVRREGITGWCAPIPDDLTPPKIVERVVTTTGNSITIVCKTDEPARIRTEYAVGDIPKGKWTAASVEPVEYKTDHTVTLTGLKSKTKYSIRQPAVDEIGNLGGDVRSSGINYQVVTAVTN